MHNNNEGACAVSSRSSTHKLGGMVGNRACRLIAAVICLAPLLAVASPAVYSSLPATNVVYLRSIAGQPWGVADYDGALTTVFGSGWQDLRYETVNPAALFGSTNKFIFMEGGADSGIPMGTFLTNNLPAISNWVASGGSLFINDAPYFGGTFPMYLGFGVTATVGNTTTSAGVTNRTHTIFNGPFLPVVATYTGTSFGHATIAGVGLTPLLTNSTSGNMVLAERKYGPGHLIFGGMTAPSFHSPQPQATNLVYNILTYAGNLGAIPPSSRVAIYGAELNTGWNSDVSNKVFNTSLFNQVDFYLATGGQPTPTLAQLQQYGAVLVYSDNAFDDATALGNALADYADSGGGVVLAVFGMGTVGGYTPAGRLASGGYFPFTLGNTASLPALSLVPNQPSHPILSGVASFNGGSSSYRHAPTSPTAGASLIASWSNGDPLVGTKRPTAGRVVGLNFFPPSSDSRSDFWTASTDGAKLLANSLFWAANGGTTNVSTTNGWNGITSIGTFGEANTATYGQTFIAPAATPVLTSFKLYLSNTLNTVTFRFYVMAWDGAKATGPLLFQSPVTSTAATSGWQPFTFNTSQLSLTPGGSYVAFACTSTVQDGGTTAALMGALPADPYPSGGFVYMNNGTNFSALTSTTWNTIGGYDMAFIATFSGGVLGVPPGIVTQPASQAVSPGGTAVFNVTASGTSALTYQWKHAGTNLTDSVRISGTQTSALTVSNANASDAGYYYVAVSNSAGFANSQSALLTVLPPLTVGIAAAGDANERNALYTTLTNLGFNVALIANGQWAGVNVIVSYPGNLPFLFGPSSGVISNGFGYIQISDWAAAWTPFSYVTLLEGTNLTINVGTPHPITAGLPASWTAHGFWRYGDSFEDYLGYTANAALPSLASETVTGKSRVLTANTLNRGRAVLIGWNVYGPDAGVNDVAVLRNSILWAGQANPPLMFVNALSSRTNGFFNFTWTTVPGYSYQVQYKSNLYQPAWLNLGSPIAAVGTLAAGSDSLANSNRIYRVQLLP